MNKIRENRGTALLTAMLIMGVLISVSIALSSLVFREIKVTKDLIDAGKAYYAAESGVEEALYYLNNKLPGWEPTAEASENKVALDSGSEFKYQIKNTCHSYPCFEDKTEYDVASAPAEAFYGSLGLNESLLLPLFVVGQDPNDGGDVVNSVKNFTVEFYGNFDPGADLKIDNMGAWDILRWKVFGMKKDGNDYVTQSISDFTAFAKGKLISASAGTPAWFGSVGCSDVDQTSRVVDKIRCSLYVLNEQSLCDASLRARDYYSDDASGEVSSNKCYSIKQFTDDHQKNDTGMTGLNYLSLTNMMNPSMFADSPKFATEQARIDASKIFFRVETYDDKTVREYAEITADGYSNGAKQSIKVMKKRDSYMPVFNFSIYSTYGSSNEYYVGENKPNDQLPQ